ncbi:MAG TPA: glycosyl hydrolase family 8 [Mycobacteriales bacterium]|nr:glycosyl hydrolase family 8 [Mycobacteriales bacterium]
MGWPRPGAAAAAVALVATLCLGGCGSSDGAAQPQQAQLDARGFFQDYVTAEGAVVRHDQGGDVVSEGQGYAMLLAFALDDPQRFAKVWAWTRANLQRPDGLFAYHWQDGAVVDATPAADADTQIAWALSLAGHAWSLPDDTAAARRIAEAVAESEIGYDAHGHPTLAAGPWAIAPGHPVQVEPGYWTFPAYAALAKLTGDHRWQALTAADASHLSAVSGQGSALPPDWATVGRGAEPASAPQTGTAPASGQDGLRAIVWAACLPATHDLVTRWWRTLAPTARVGPLTRSLEGAPVSEGPSPLSLVAAASAAEVAGDTKTAGSLLALARHTAAEHSTYYGDAWAALGQLLLSGRLPGCSV